MVLGGIYEIANTVNGNRYLGSSVSFKVRRNQHIRLLRRGKHHSPHLQSAWNKYGEAAFVFKPLLICKSEDLLFYEQRALDVCKPVYNVCKYATSTLGVKCSPETRARISAAKKGIKICGANSAKTRTGLKRSPETCAKISATKLGQKYRPHSFTRSAETRARMSAAQVGKPRNIK